MSLANFALRIITVQMLKGRTLAEARVHDSDIGTIDQRATGTRQPFILVYTDEEKVDLNGSKEFYTGGKIRLSIEAVVADVLPMKDAEGVTLNLPNTDAMIEMQLDLIRRQITRAMTDQENPWSDLWNGLVIRGESIDIQRGASADKSVRFAARQNAYLLEVLNDPVPGEPLEGVWLRIVEAFEANGSLAKFGKIIRAEVEGTSGLEDWATVQQTLGLTEQGLAALGHGPLPGAEAPITQMTIRAPYMTAVMTPDGEEVRYE
jgi:hypothetical protein